MAILADFFSLWTSYENCQLCFMQPHCWERLLFLASKPIRMSSCSKTYRFIVSNESFQGCLLVAHFHQPWARVYESLTTFKIHVIAALLSFVRWPLLDRYLLELNLTPHSSDSPCASHVMLAIMEHLVCGTNSHCFSRTQKPSLEANHDCSGPLGRPLLSVTFLVEKEDRLLG
jgi:hypothetical protein